MNPIILQGQPAGPDITFLGLIFIAWIFMMFMMNRSKKKNQLEREQTINAIKKGDQVLIMNSIAGEVDQIKEGFFHVKIADKTIIKVNSSGVTPLTTEEKA